MSLKNKGEDIKEKKLFYGATVGAVVVVVGTTVVAPTVVGATVVLVPPAQGLHPSAGPEQQSGV